MSRTSGNGRLIARALAGSWRRSPPALYMSADNLGMVAPALLASGAGALGWWRVQNSSLATSSAALELQQAYRLHALQAARHRRDLRDTFRLLRAASLEAILVKGWAVARLYPEQGLRPYGDIDLCIRPQDSKRAKEVLAAVKDSQFIFDFHEGFTKLDDRDWSQIYARSQLFKINEVTARVPGPEDHLRILCYHFLREGAWRPLWLCDIAVSIESVGADFNWDLFFGTDKKRREWFVCALALAHHLLNANIEKLPREIKDKRLPDWLLPAVLKAWEVRSMARRHQTPMTTAWRTPVPALANLRYHWPNPVEGTIGMQGSFNELPRLPYQLGNCLLRTVDFLRHLPKLLRG